MEGYAGVFTLGKRRCKSFHAVKRHEDTQWVVDGKRGKVRPKGGEHAVGKLLKLLRTYPLINVQESEDVWANELRFHILA